MNMPSTWPRSSASYTPGSGMPTGVELLRQVGGFAAELHVRIDLDLHLAAGFLVDLLRPGKEMARLVGCLRTRERVHLEQDLRMRGKAERGERGDGDGFHGHSLE